ncbi:MAG: 2-phospho-L-lactate guanylyltransferase, partial [Chloroflexota bacterium]
RLSEVLTPEQRTQLAETTLRKTLSVVTQLPQVAGVLVISRDGRVLSMAREMGVHTVQESGAPELNNALMRATRVLAGWRADAVLVLPSDIPLINVEDLTQIIKLGQNNNSVVIATDDHHDGTNALFVRPPGMFSYAYGENSFNVHQGLGRLAGAAVHVYESERLMLDLDTPEDLEKYNAYVHSGKFDAAPLMDDISAPIESEELID